MSDKKKDFVKKIKKKKKKDLEQKKIQIVVEK